MTISECTLTHFMNISSLTTLNRDAGGGGGARAPQVLGYQLTLFGPRGADYGPPIFLYDAASLQYLNVWKI